MISNLRAGNWTGTFFFFFSSNEDQQVWRSGRLGGVEASGLAGWI